MKRVLALALAAAALGAASPARADETRTETYLAGAVGDADGPCRTDPSNPTGLNLGSVCFENVSAFRHVTIRVTDTAPYQVGYWVGLLNASRTSLGGTFHCVPEVTKPIVQGARTVLVYIAGPVVAAQFCVAQRMSPGTGTVGTVRAILRTT